MPAIFSCDTASQAWRTGASPFSFSHLVSKTNPGFFTKYGWVVQEGVGGGFLYHPHPTQPVSFLFLCPSGWLLEMRGTGYIQEDLYVRPVIDMIVWEKDGGSEGSNPVALFNRRSEKQ